MTDMQLQPVYIAGLVAEPTHLGAVRTLDEHVYKAQACMTGVFWCVAAHYSRLPGHLVPLLDVM